MPKRYHFKQLELLRNQLLFAPLNVRKRFIFRLEKLLPRLDVTKTYPYEYICHKITNYRPTDSPPLSLTGPRLQADLLHMLGDLGGSIDMHVRSVSASPSPPSSIS
jgi:RNA polymerase primary sigma factor